MNAAEKQHAQNEAAHHADALQRTLANIYLLLNEETADQGTLPPMPGDLGLSSPLLSTAN